eukprot:203381-Prymnesium_polylepis.1
MHASSSAALSGEPRLNAIEGAARRDAPELRAPADRGSCEGHDGREFGGAGRAAGAAGAGGGGGAAGTKGAGVRIVVVLLI